MVPQQTVIEAAFPEYGDQTGIASSRASLQRKHLARPAPAAAGFLRWGADSACFLAHRIDEGQLATPPSTETRAVAEKRTDRTPTAATETKRS
jgi:hypothetical protein